MPKSVELIKSKEYENFLACIDDAVYAMSDFERFAFVCENISLMQGSMLRKKFFGALKSDTGMAIPPSALKSREVQKHLWRVINGVAKEIPEYKREFEDIHCKTDDCAPINLNLSLKKNSLPDNIDVFIEQIDRELLVDLSGLRYRRPDEYHAVLTYERIRKGEACDNEEFCALICWIVCRALMKRDITLYLLADESAETAFCVLSLLEGRKLYPDIRLCFCPSAESVSRMSDICLNSCKKNISPEIFIHEECFDIKNIKMLFSLLPASRIYFCDFLSCKIGKRIFDDALRTAVQEK